MTGPKRMSDRQLAANRANAQCSTGPRTPEGQAAVRHNALKHGILAQAIIPEALAPYESREAFDELLSTLRNEFDPANTLEELLVEQIATAYWRLARLYRAEAGAIAARQDDSQHGRELLRELESAFSPSTRLSPVQEANQLESSLTNKRDLRTVMSRHDPALRTATDEEVRARADALLAALRERAAQEQHHQQAVVSAERSLPGLDAALKFARYETALQNQLDRALSRLERLQRLRGGEFVAPPLQIEVSQTGESAGDLP